VNRVIAIAGSVGAGKSTLVRGLASRLPSATAIHFDHYERMTEQPIEKIRQWMKDGADLNEMPVPGLADALRALKEGRGVQDPLTGRTVQPASSILFETQFGRQHAATGQHIDFLVWIDTPLDVALARKVRQFASEIDTRDPGELAGFGPWLQAYLDNYLEVVGGLLRLQRDTVGANADLVVDGTCEPGELSREVERAILKTT
jgi:uridine kinase